MPAPHPRAEQWRPVVGYEGAYEVSDLGRVRSLDRAVPAGRGRTRKSSGRVLSQYLGNYAKVRLKVDGAGSTKNVHALVAETFLGPRPDGLEVCHNNGDASDNRLANLRYDTHSANQSDQIAHGTNPWSRRTHCSKGHEFTPENTRTRGPNENGRRCGTCEDERGRARWRRELARRSAA